MTPKTDIEVLREALEGYRENVEADGKQMAVPYEIYRAAFDGWRFACSPDRITRILDQHAKAIELLGRSKGLMDRQRPVHEALIAEITYFLSELTAPAKG